MSAKKISELDAVTSASPTDLLLIVHSGSSYKITTANFLTQPNTAVGSSNNQTEAEYSFSVGEGNTQAGYCCTQIGLGNTQAGVFCLQSGLDNTQVGEILGDFQAGEGNTQSGSYSLQSGRGNTQSGSYCLQVGRQHISQSGENNIQSGRRNTQSGGQNSQSGYDNTQSGYMNTQSGAYHSQSGTYNTQFGGENTQSGVYNFQAGQDLNDGGFNYVTQLGQGNTAAIGNTIYFAAPNGIRLKTFSSPPSNPEEGTFYWDSNTHTLQVYNGTAWQTVSAS